MEKNRTYLLAPFDLKDELKKEGIKWDAEKKLWYSLEITETLKPFVAFFVENLCWPLWMQIEIVNPETTATAVLYEIKRAENIKKSKDQRNKLPNSATEGFPKQ
jgi:hypothetical protein